MPAVSGQLDYQTTPNARERLMAMLATRPALVVIDLVGVDFLGSAGLVMLAEAAQLCGSEITMRVVAAGPATLRPVQLTGLQGFLDLHPTVEGALTIPRS